MTDLIWRCGVVVWWTLINVRVQRVEVLLCLKQARQSDSLTCGEYGGSFLRSTREEIIEEGNLIPDNDDEGQLTCGR